MERIYRIILEQHLRRLNAVVTLAAWSSFAPGFSMGRSRPHGFRLVYVTKGTGWIEVNGKRYGIKPGSYCLLPAGFEQSCGVPGTEPVEAYWVQFDANLGEAELVGMLKLPVCVDVGGNPDIVRLFEAMVESFNDSSITSVLRTKAALFEALACFLEQCRVDEKALDNIDSYVKLGKVLDYIDHHLADNLTLEELAKIAYLHPNYFVSLFKNMVGQPPIHYVNMQRLEKAKRLLEETDIPISGVAAAVGMQNHYLSRMFKQHTGISPTRYRKLFGERRAGAERADLSTGAAPGQEHAAPEEAAEMICGPEDAGFGPAEPKDAAPESAAPGASDSPPAAPEQAASASAVPGQAVPGQADVEPSMPVKPPAVPVSVLPQDTCAGAAGPGSADTESVRTDPGPVPAAAAGSGGAGYGRSPE